MHGITRKKHIKDCSAYYKEEKKLIFNTCLFTTFPRLPKNLIKLRCLSCPFIGSLPKLPESLKVLECIGCNSLGNISQFPPTLKIFKCTKTEHLNSLPKFPDTLQILELFGNLNLDFIPNFPEGLEYLDISLCTKLRSLPSVKYLQNLKYLNFSATTLDYFPDLPENLETLICYNTDFKNLPRLPKKLEILNIDGYIERLPELPETLIELHTAWSTLQNTIKYFLNILRGESEESCLYVQSQVENRGFLKACERHKVDLEPVLEVLKICLDKRQVELSQELSGLETRYPRDLAKLISSYDTGSNFKSGFKRSKKGFVGKKKSKKKKSR